LLSFLKYIANVVEIEQLEKKALYGDRFAIEDDKFLLIGKFLEVLLRNNNNSFFLTIKAPHRI
jgi:hypothetical protein